MAEAPSQASPQQPASGAGGSDSDYWCYHCDKRVSVEKMADLPDVICYECKHGFVESIPAAPSLLLPIPSSDEDRLHPLDDPSLGSQFLQVLRLIAQAAREDDVTPPPPSNPPSDDDFLRIELDGWDNDEDEDEEEEEDDDDDDAGNGNEQVIGEGGEDATADGEGGGRSDIENGETREEIDEDERRRRRRDELHLRIQDIATRARSGRNRILDWAEILMGLDDNSIELRFEVPESDRFIGNPADYVDDAGYQALLQNLAESDSGRRGAPPAAKAAISELLKVEIKSKEEVSACAICKDMVNVGGIATRLPCGHDYHGDCIVPWLGSRNSCPVCRFELPTDDPEYEEERKKRVALSSGSASGSGGDNFGLD